MTTTPRCAAPPCRLPPTPDVPAIARSSTRSPPAQLAMALAAAPANARHGLHRAAWAALARLGDPASAALFDRALAGEVARTRLDAALARGDDPRARAALDEEGGRGGIA